MKPLFVQIGNQNINLNQIAHYVFTEATDVPAVSTGAPEGNLTFPAQIGGYRANATIVVTFSGTATLRLEGGGAEELKRILEAHRL